MKKKNLFAAVAVALVLACGAALAACSSNPDPKEVITADIATQFDPVKNLDQTAVDELAADVEAANDLKAYGLDGVAYVQSMLSGFDYEVKDVTVDESGENAVATVVITCKSFTDATARATELSEELANSEELLDMSMDEMNKKIGEIMLQAMDETQVKSTDCTFDYKLVDGTWTIQDNAEQQLSNAFFA